MRMPALRAAFGRFAESPAAVISLAITLVMLFAAVFAPLLAPTDPYDLTKLQLADALKTVGSRQLAPAEEVRLSVHVGAGPAEATAPGAALLGVSATPCGEGCVDIAALPPDLALGSLQIRDLPAGADVDGARKHPVQPWWTVQSPDGPVRITGLAQEADIQVIAKSLPQETGLTFYLGTDGFGRDMLSAILYGIRISLTVGLITAATAMILGTGLGLVAAWRGGVADALIMRAVDFMLGFPALLVGLVVLAVLGSGVVALSAAIAFRRALPAAFLPQRHQRAGAGRLHALDDELVLRAPGIGREPPLDDDLQPFFRAKAETLGRALPGDGGDHRLVILHVEIDMTRLGHDDPAQLAAHADMAKGVLDRPLERTGEL
mgnify:CR=1 FL=1